MRVSIWQQWASNHSSHFTVMGKFAAVEEAQDVGVILREMLVNVFHGKQAYEEERWRIYLSQHHLDSPTQQDRKQFEREHFYHAGPCPVEQQIAAEYGVEWPHSIEQLYDEASAAAKVNVVDRAVILKESYVARRAWIVPIPSLAQILDKLGAELAIEAHTSRFTTRGRITIVCRAPDEETSAQIMQQVRTHDRKLPPGVRLFSLRDLRIDRYDEPPVFQGTVGHTQQQFTFTFYETANGDLFTALLEYLRARGCTISDYTFETEDHS